MRELIGHVAVVTGGASGIGRASALRLARGGLAVGVLDVAADVDFVVAEIESSGGRALAVRADLRDDSALMAGLGRVEQELGPIDVLHNNAGGSARGHDAGLLWERPLEVLDRVLDLNLRTTILTSRYVAPGMRDRGRGRIVNTSSIVTVTAPAGFADYTAAKAGVLGFTRALANELSPTGVTVNAVLPGLVRTRVLDEVDDAHLQALRQAGPFVEPEDVANAVAFLASSDARYITGVGLPITAGQVVI